MMNTPNPSHNPHSILQHISGLTAQKDFDLLNFSLLKSLSALMPKSRVQALAVTQENRIVKQFTYARDGLDVNISDINVESRVKSALIRAHQAGLEEYVELIDNQPLAIFELSRERVISYYLLVAFPRTITNADTYLITGVLEIYRNFSSLLINAQTDELTGLANRKTFATAIGRVYDSAQAIRTTPNIEQRSKNSSDDDEMCFWICAIDIDHFKAVNDNFGHLFGDEVLIRLAQLMQTEFRIDDLLFRFGGEEFIALVKAPDRKSVDVVLERFRRAVEKLQFSQIGSVTVSLGVVKVDPSVFHMTLMDYADQALYYSKQNGRNQVSFFEDLVAKGIARTETFEEGEVDLF